MSLHYKTIDTPAALENLCKQLNDSEWLALDTEFLRDNTYYPELCLIQIATPEHLACIDPLALESLEPLTDLLFDNNICKVFHAAQQDLEIFYHAYGALPQPLFDTQLAASLLGHGEQIGYAALVEIILGKQLSKSQTRTNWKQRPLSDAQLEYAADDVLYLREIYPLMRDQLASLKRQDWLNEEFANLTSHETYRTDPLTTWKRIKGVQKLSRTQLAVLQQLAAWRENEAMVRNLPRKWIVADHILTDIARQKPQDLEALESIRGIQKSVVSRHGHSILCAIETALKLPEDQLPNKIKSRRLPTEMEPVVDLMSAVLRKLAAEHSISPALIASRKTLERFALGDSDTGLSQGWRKRLAGALFESLLSGEITISVNNGNLQLVTLCKENH